MAVKTMSDVEKHGNTNLALGETKKASSMKKTATRPRLRFYFRVVLALGWLISTLRGGKRRSGLLDVLPRAITREGVVLEHHIREGRFQRSLSLVRRFQAC